MKEQNIVLVEDNSEIRELIGLILGNAHYSLTMYGTAHELKEYLAKNIPDVIVMDISLPDGNGIDICREIKDDPTTSHIPVILMSANAYDRIKVAHADAFIAKPFDINQFRKTVEYNLADA